MLQFQTLGEILCASGTAQQMGPLLAERFTQRRVFVVTDKGVRSAGLLDAPLAAMTAIGFDVALFDAVVADPPEPVVLDALALARGHQTDCVIGFGGGSSMDTAKLVAVLLGTDAPLASLYGIGQVRGQRQVPLVQVPTTAGTGSEVTPISVITTGQTTKSAVIAPQLLADLAILDADLTLKLPPPVTAATGIDAIVHAIEAFTSRIRKNPISDMLALKALELLTGNLAAAVEDGSDIGGREALLLGACFAGQAFANAPVGAVHALAYPLGGIFHISHGLSNALVLPHVLRFNCPDAAPLYAELARKLGFSSASSTQAAAEAFIDAIEALALRTGIERRLRDVGVPHAALADLAGDALLLQRMLVNNPRAVTFEDALAIYQAAW